MTPAITTPIRLAIWLVIRSQNSEAPTVCTTSQPIHAVTGGKST